MKTATLLRVWTVLTLGWLVFLGPALVSRYQNEPDAPSTAWAVQRSAWVTVLSLASALAVHILYRRGVRKQSGEVDGRLVIDVSPKRGLPGFAQVVTALGATLLLAQGSQPACAGIVLGLLVTAFGAFLLHREILRIEPGERRLLRSNHLLGYPLTASEVLLPREKPIRLERLSNRGVVLLVGEVTLASGLEHEEAVRIAETAGPALGREVKDNTVHAPAPSVLVRGLRGLANLPGIALLALLLGLGVAWMVPAGRSALCRLAVAPHPPFSQDVRIPALRTAAARHLAADPTDENLLALLKVANTADPQQSPEVLAATIAKLLALAGEDTAAEGDPLGRINRWAARRLGRTLDANDGVLGWYPVEEERYRRALDEMAGDDVQAAASAWSAFGLGDLTNPEDFLWAVGPALADRRPIHFVLRNAGGPEALSERREGTADFVLAETVGEAVALRLWGYDGVDGAQFPEDFWEWWAGYARARHLPPGGPGAR